MRQEEPKKSEKKEALKALRRSRKEWIAEAAAKVKAQKKALGAIRGQIESGAGTVPEIANATGMSSAEVLWYMATLKKYGEIVETEKDGSFFRYALTESAV
jgi:predicted transcriptional regulator